MHALDEHFLATVSALPVAPRQDAGAEVAPGLTGTRLLELFDSQIGSRHLDFASRDLGKLVPLGRSSARRSET